MDIKAQVAVYRAVLIAIVVSVANSCEYCINHHAEALTHYWKDNKMVQKFIHDFHSIKLSERKRKMLEYAHKLTKTPHLIEKSDVDDLKKRGFSEEEILNINLITCYFNFVNRIALGLDVKFSNDELTGYKY